MKVSLNYYEGQPAAASLRERRPPGYVLGLDTPSGSASPVGNTFYTRLKMCPHEWALFYIAKLRSAYDDDNLTTGWLYHFAHEHFGRALMAGASRADAERKAFEVLQPLAGEEGYQDTYAKLEKMLGGWFDHYRAHDDWTYLAVEEQLAVTRDLGWEFDYSARLDGVWLGTGNAGKGVWICELKTTKALTLDLVEGYQMNQQILGQVWLFKQVVDLTRLPGPFMGAIIDITTKHATPRYERVEVCPSAAHLAAFERSISACARMLPVYRDLDWPRDFTRCAGPLRAFKRCQYFDLCHAYPQYGISDHMKADPPYGLVRAGQETIDDAEDDAV